MNDKEMINEIKQDFKKHKEKHKQIEEMAIIDCQRVPKGLDCSDCQFANVYNCNSYRMATALYNADYRNCKDKVVLDKEEHTALINDFNALKHKYEDICDRYRLCKNENETIKQHAVMTRKETAREIYYLCKKDFIGLDEIGLKVLKSIIKNNFGVEVKE